METTEILKYNESMEDKGSPMCQTSLLKKKTQKESQSSAIAVSPQQNKKMTSQGKSSSCGKNSPMPKSSKTSEADSTTKEKDCNPFYDDFCKEISSHLLSHTEIDFAVSDLNSYNSLLKKTEGKSWFSISQNYLPNENSQKTCWQFFTSSHAGCTGLEGTKIKSRKIRIYPTQEQKHIFRCWFGVSRKVYNTTVDYFNRDDKETINWMKVANIIFPSLTEDYMKNVPYQIKKIAIKDCSTSFKNGCKKAKETGEGFKLSYRTRKNPKQSCYIPKSALSDEGIYHTLTGRLKMKERHLLEKGWQDLRLVCEYGRWYLSVPVVIAEVAENQSCPDVVALDPGIRAFMTYFSEDGKVGKIAEGSFKKILKIHYKIECLISKKDLEKCKEKKRRIYRKIGRLRLRLHDLIDELHWKTINFLTSNFAVILLPTFETREMVCKKTRKIKKFVVKVMQSYRFFEFAERLQTKCREKGIVLIRCNESYTSKTNSFDGSIMNIGSKSSFKYKGITVDRDINGARNIMLRAMRDSSAAAEMLLSISIKATNR